MNSSILYELMRFKCVFEIREKIERQNDCITKKDLEAEREKIEAILDDNGKKLLKNYSLALENWLDYISYQVNIEILNTAIKIGMELQCAFDNFDE